MSHFDVQRQIRESVEKMQSEMLELREWEQEIQAKDDQIKRQPTTQIEAPPVRGTKAYNDFVSGKTQPTPSVSTPSPSSSLDEAEELKQKGNKFFQQNNLPEAIKLYTESLALSPSPATFSNRSFSHFKMGDFYMALDDANSAISLDPFFYKAYVRRSNANRRLGRLGDAAIDLENALKHAPTKVHHELLKELGEIQRLQSAQIVENQSKIKEELISSVKIDSKDTSSPNQFDGRILVQEISTEHQDEKKEEQKEQIPLNQESSEISSEISSEKQGKPVIKSTQDPSSQPSSSFVPALPPVPSTLSEVELGFRELEGFPKLLTQYVYSIDPKKLVSIFKNGLSTPIFNTIISSLLNIDDLNFIYEFLLNMSKVSRFSFVALFIKDKTLISNLFDRLNSGDFSELESLKKTYKL
ncbi:hypothetical protein RCL1_008351 [Eukaryota sp. TZLM3-RCL]